MVRLILGNTAEPEGKRYKWTFYVRGETQESRRALVFLFCVFSRRLFSVFSESVISVSCRMWTPRDEINQRLLNPGFRWIVAAVCGTVPPTETNFTSGFVADQEAPAFARLRIQDLESVTIKLHSSFKNPVLVREEEPFEFTARGEN